MTTARAAIVAFIASVLASAAFFAAAPAYAEEPAGAQPAAEENESDKSGAAITDPKATTEDPGATTEESTAEQPAENEARDREARKLFEKGNRNLERATRARGKRQERLLQKALDSYTRCIELVRSPYAIFNMALTLEQLERHREAFGYYTEYLAYRELSVEERAEATGRRDGLLPHLAVVAIDSSPAGATIYLDSTQNEPIGVAPIQVAVPGGSHLVIARLEGFHDHESPVVVRVGERVPVVATLVSLTPPEPVEPEPEQEEAPPQPGSIVVDSWVPAIVFLDGVRRDQGRNVRIETEPGAHHVRVEAPDHEPVESAVVVEEGATHKLKANLALSRRGERRLAPWPLVAWIATGATGVAWAILGVRALSLNDEYEDDPSQSNFDAVEDANAAADVALGFTAALGVTALTLTLLDGPVEQEKSRIAVDVGVDDKEFTLSARGGFEGL
jgi:hypothetical protein